MDVVLVAAAVLLAIGTFSATLLVFPAMWQGFRRQWSRFPRDARRRGTVGGIASLAYAVLGGVLLITAPWGPRSVLYVIAVGGGALTLLTLGAVAVTGIGHRRRMRRRG